MGDRPGHGRRRRPSRAGGRPGPWPSTGGTPVRAAAACTITSMVMAPGVPGRWAWSSAGRRRPAADARCPRRARRTGPPRRGCRRRGARPRPGAGGAPGGLGPGRGGAPATDAGGVVGEHPDVLGQRTAHAGDQRRGGIGVDARQAAGHDVVTLGVGDAEGAQHEPAGGEPTRGHHRRRGHRHRLLADPRPRLRLDLAPQVVATGGVQRPAEARRQDRPPGDGLDDEALEVGQHVGAGDGIAAPPRARRGQQQVLAEEPVRHVGEEGHQAGVLQHARTQRVGQPHRTAAGRLEEAGDAELGVGPQLERVAEVGVHAAQHHVDLLAAGGAADPQPAVADAEVVGLHQREAQQGRQEPLVVRRLEPEPGESSTTRGISTSTGAALPRAVAIVWNQPRSRSSGGVAVHVGQHPAVTRRLAIA